MNMTEMREHLHHEFQGEQFQEALSAIDGWFTQSLSTDEMIEELRKITIRHQLSSTDFQADPYYVLSWCLQKRRLATYQEWFTAIRSK